MKIPKKELAVWLNEKYGRDARKAVLMAVCDGQAPTFEDEKYYLALAALVSRAPAEIEFEVKR